MQIKFPVQKKQVEILAILWRLKWLWITVIVGLGLGALYISQGPREQRELAPSPYKTYTMASLAIDAQNYDKALALSQSLSCEEYPTLQALNQERIAFLQKKTSK